MRDQTNSPKCRRRAKRDQEEPQPPSGWDWDHLKMTLHVGNFKSYIVWFKFCIIDMQYWGRRWAKRDHEEPQPPSGWLFRASQNDLTYSREAQTAIWLTDWDHLKRWMISHVGTLRNMKRIMHQKRFPRVQEYWYQYHWPSCLCHCEMAAWQFVPIVWGN